VCRKGISHEYFHLLHGLNMIQPHASSHRRPSKGMFPRHGAEIQEAMPRECRCCREMRVACSEACRMHMSSQQAWRREGSVQADTNRAGCSAMRRRTSALC